MSDFTLASKAYSDNNYRKANSFTRANIFEGALDADLEIGYGPGRSAYCEFTAGDPTHSGVLVRKVNGADVCELSLGVYPGRTYYELAKNITQNKGMGVVAKYLEHDKKIRLVEKTPGESGNDVVFEMKATEEGIVDPCFGEGSVAMSGGSGEGEASERKITVNGVEFTAEDISILRTIIDERKSSV